MTSKGAEVRTNFAAAAHWFADLVGRVGPDDWSRPGLGVWSVRDLVGHGSRSLVTVDTYLDRPAQQVAAASPWAYYGATRLLMEADPDSVIERGRQAGVAMGADPPPFVTDLAIRVLGRLPGDDPVIETIVGGMRLDDYLPTRTLELVVHGFDLASALDLTPPDLPPSVLAEVTDVSCRLAISDGQGPALVLALTGRRPLPPAFSVM